MNKILNFRFFITILTCIAMAMPYASGDLHFSDVISLGLKGDVSFGKLGYIMSEYFLLIFLAGLWSFQRFSLESICVGSVYIPSSITVILHDNLITFFCVWEMMSISSVFLIWQARDCHSRNGGFAYLLLHLLGGFLLLLSLISFSHGSFEVLLDNSFRDLIIGISLNDKLCVLCAILINCAIFPLSFLVYRGYSSSPSHNILFLSIFTTKTAFYFLYQSVDLIPKIYVDVIVCIGAFMALVGAIYALFEENLRRMLSCSLLSQMGFMLYALCSLREENSYALHDMNALLLCGILYFALFCASIICFLHSDNENGRELGMICSIVAGLGMSGMPLYMGFSSKVFLANLMPNIEYFGYFAHVLILIASGATFLYSVLKLPTGFRICYLQGERIELSKVPLLLLCGACMCIGLYFVYSDFGDFEYYNMHNILHKIFLFFTSTVVMVFLMRFKEKFFHIRLPHIDSILLKIFSCIIDVLQGMYSSFCESLHCAIRSKTELKLLKGISRKKCLIYNDADIALHLVVIFLCVYLAIALNVFHTVH